MTQQPILPYLWFAERYYEERNPYTHEWQCTCEKWYRVIVLHITVYFTAHSVIIKQQQQQQQVRLYVKPHDYNPKKKNI